MPPLAGGVLVAELLTDNYENISRQRQVVVVVVVVETQNLFIVRG